MGTSQLHGVPIKQYWMYWGRGGRGEGTEEDGANEKVLFATRENFLSTGSPVDCDSPLFGRQKCTPLRCVEFYAAIS